MNLNGPDPEISLKFNFTLSEKQALIIAGRVALGGKFTLTMVSAMPEQPSLSFTSIEYVALVNGFRTKDSLIEPLFHKTFRSPPFIPIMGFNVIESPKQIFVFEGKVTEILFVVET